MAKNYNSSENCHNEADKHTSNRNASRNTSNKNVYGKNASDRNVTDKNANNKMHMTKMRKTRILTIMEMRTAATSNKEFPCRTYKSASCFLPPCMCNELPKAGDRVENREILYVKWVDKERRLSVR